MHNNKNNKERWKSLKVCRRIEKLRKDGRGQRVTTNITGDALKYCHMRGKQFHRLEKFISADVMNIL